MKVNKIILLLFLLPLAWLNVFSSPSGRLVTPYFKAIEYYDYVVKGEVISTKERIYHYNIKAAALQVKIIDKIGQEIGDTVWIEPFVEEGYGAYDYEKLSGQYYFAFKSNEKGFFYHSDSPYSLLKITNGTVYTLFRKYRVYVSRLLFYHFRRYTKMKTDKFEKMLKRKLDEKRLIGRK